MNKLTWIGMAVLALAGCKDQAAPDRSAPKAARAPSCTVVTSGKGIGDKAASSDRPVAVDVKGDETYCIGDVTLSAKTRIGEAQASLPPTCKTENKIGASEVRCDGLMLTFVGPDQQLARLTVGPGVKL